MGALLRYLTGLTLLFCLADINRVSAAEEATPTVSIVFVGDVMLDELPGDVIARGGDPFAAFAPALLAADITIGNLECVIATGGEQADKSYHFRAHPRTIPILARYFDGLSVANNHSGDFGPRALVEQCELLERAGLPYFGGGRNLADAHRPLLLARNGLRIAILGYNEYVPAEFEATTTQAGVAWSHDDQVVRDIRHARQELKADLVIPFMHWGEEYFPEPNERQTSLARTMIDAGADVVVGGHPHVTQGAGSHQQRLIVYSLGNFVFNGFQPGPQRTGWLLRMKLSKAGLESWEIQVAHLDENGLPQLAPSDKGN